jgi:6-phosphogluconolactonase
MGAADVTLSALWNGGSAYVANYTDHTISQYTIGPNGVLTPMNPATVGAGNGPSSVAVDPLHKYAYVTNSTGNTISQFNIGTNGALTPTSPATARAGSGPTAIATFRRSS